MANSEKNPTAAELKARTGKWFSTFLNYFVVEAFKLIEARYEMGVTDTDGKKLYYAFTKKIRSLKDNDRPYELLDEFKLKLGQGDFLDYKRKDCQTLRSIKNRQATQAKRALQSQEDDDDE